MSFKQEYLRNFIFSPYVVGIYKKWLAEALQLSTHNICYHGKYQYISAETPPPPQKNTTTNNKNPNNLPFLLVRRVHKIRTPHETEGVNIINGISSIGSFLI